MTKLDDDAVADPPTPVDGGDERHHSHPNLLKRLKRANGHLAAVIAMIETGRPCLEVAQQLYAVERAIAAARRTFIEDHIDHCLDAAVEGGADLAEFKAIARYL